jgi:hypothetical protein
VVAVQVGDVTAGKHNVAPIAFCLDALDREGWRFPREAPDQ